VCCLACRLPWRRLQLEDIIKALRRTFVQAMTQISLVTAIATERRTPGRLMHIREAAVETIGSLHLLTRRQPTRQRTAAVTRAALSDNLKLTHTAEKCY